MGQTTFDFSGQVAVITGGARGIGKGSAEAFARAGAEVWVVDIDEKDGEGVAAGIRRDGGRATFLACDVTDARQVRAGFARILAEAGRLDVLVNSAGGFWKQLSVEETPEEEWDRVVDLNLKSIFLAAQAAIPAFKRQGSGRIISIGSMAGVSTLQPSSPPYSAAKAGVHALTRVLAFELGKHGRHRQRARPGHDGHRARGGRPEQGAAGRDRQGHAGRPHRRGDGHGGLGSVPGHAGGRLPDGPDHLRQRRPLHGVDRRVGLGRPPRCPPFGGAGEVRARSGKTNR
jgi:NAD(P)-dependent dehydrogenase (short-subunit alcohol dehydrogenase family)